MRLIDEHHDGHGLNESILLAAADEPENGASHRYLATLCDSLVLDLRFQQGPRNVEGSSPGITEAVLYAVLLDRLRGFQAGPYPSEENAKQVEWLEACLASTKKRADERAARGVLGTYNK